MIKKPIKYVYLAPIIFSVVSGICSGFALRSVYYMLGWICYVPLYVLILRYPISNKKVFLFGALTFFIQGLVLFHWILDVSTAYTGTFTVLSIAVTILFSCVNALKGGLILIVFHQLNKHYQSNLKDILKRVVLFAVLFVVINWLYTRIFIELPWLISNIGYTQASNLFIAQWAEIAGAWLLLFITIIINALIAEMLIQKSFRVAIVTIGFLIFILGYGFVRVRTFDKNIEDEIKVALICDNTLPAVRWQEKFVDQYVSKLFDLNEQALKENPDLIIWNEGVIPWTYRPDDDFLVALLKQSKSSHPLHLISYFTEYPNNREITNNTAFLFRNDGKILGKYDKYQLLGGLEKPLWNIQPLKLPFFNPQAGGIHIGGSGINLVECPQIGDFGVMICNESLTDNIALRESACGASFLVLIANNSWFKDTFLTKYHFYCSRIRAIENRKDLIINSNLGISGIITKTGVVELESQEKEGVVVIGNIKVDDHVSHYYIRKTVFLTMNFIILVMLILLTRKKRRKK